jgi:hypothetical protein
MLFLITFRVKPDKRIRAVLFNQTEPGKLDEEWMRKEFIRKQHVVHKECSRVKIEKLREGITKEETDALLKTYPRDRRVNK